MPDLFDDREVMDHLWQQLPDGLHSTLVEMAEQMYLHLAEDAQAVEQLGYTRLADIVIGQIDRVALKCGGAGFYLPKGLAHRLSERDRQILAKFNGRNAHTLAREYGVTEMRIYQIVTAARQADFDRRQGKLDIAG